MKSPKKIFRWLIGLAALFVALAVLAVCLIMWQTQESWTDAATDVTPPLLVALLVALYFLFLIGVVLIVVRFTPRTIFRWPILFVVLLAGVGVPAVGLIASGSDDSWSDVFVSVTPLILFPGVLLLVPYLLFSDWSRIGRRRRAGMILAHVEEAVRLNLPLAPMMQAAAQSETGIGRARLIDLYDHLEQGQPLGAALRSAVPELPPATTRAVTAAAEVGCLPQELRRLVRSYMPDDRFSPHLDRFYRWYAVAVTVILMTAIFGLIGIVVMPKFHAILAGFDRPMPWLTQIMWDIFTYESNSYFPLALLGLILLAIFLPWSGTLRDYLVSYIPVAGGAARDKAMAELCGFLTDALEAGQPLEAALQQASRAQPNAILRRRTQRWANRVAAGQSMFDAAKASRMPALLTGMLKSTGGGDGIVQAMSFLARHYEYRFSRLRELLRAAAIPVFVVIMGGLCLCVELSIFQPMLSLIDVLTTHAQHRGGF